MKAIDILNRLGFDDLEIDKFEMTDTVITFEFDQSIFKKTTPKEEIRISKDAEPEITLLRNQATKLENSREIEDLRRMKFIGGRIRFQRKRKEWTQKELAEKMGVSRAMLSDWEVGRKLPPSNRIKQLANIFCVPPTEIDMYYTEEKSEDDILAETLFRENIAWMREREHLSRNDVAEIIGVSKSTIDNWEAGRYLPSKKYQKKLADLYSVTPAELYLPAEAHMNNGQEANA